MTRNIGCPCGKNFSVEAPQEINLDDDPGQIDSICNGTFMTFVCPVCEKTHKPEFSIVINWKSKNLQLEVLPELERGGFYFRKKKEKSAFETVIGYPEMADRITVIKDGLEPAVIETLKYYLLMKAEENYPDREINAWYHGKGESGIEFHLDGIKAGAVAVMRVPLELYEKTYTDYRKNPKDDIFSSLRTRSYLSVQNIFKPDILT
jgi:hypothetical protein